MKSNLVTAAVLLKNSSVPVTFNLNKYPGQAVTYKGTQLKISNKSHSRKGEEFSIYFWNQLNAS